MSAAHDPFLTYMVVLVFCTMVLFCVLFFYFWYKEIQKIGKRDERDE